MPSFTGQADKEEVFKLPSAILECLWQDKAGYVNGASTLEVRTAFVADGSPIQVTLKGRDGSTLEVLKGNVYAGLYRKQVVLGAKASGGVFFEVELPEHNLKGPGPALKTAGTIVLSEPKWTDKATGKAVTLLKRHTEVDIEVKAQGAPDGAEASVTVKQKLGENRIQDLVTVPVKVQDGKIALTWIFDYRKDTASLSSQEQKNLTAETYQAPKLYFEAHCLGASIKGPEADFLDWIRCEMLDADALRMANRKFKVTFPDGKSSEVETDELGILWMEDVPPGEFTLELVGS